MGFAMAGLDGLSAYAANGSDPEFVAAFNASNDDYFRTGGADAVFSDLFTADSEAGGLAVMRDSSGNAVWNPHNLVLNSASPATQDVTVVVGNDYTVEMTGTGSVALSGAGSGTVTEGSPVEITASTTTLTLTVSGSVDTMWAYRSDLGGMANNPDTDSKYVPTTTTARYLLRRRSHYYDGSEYKPTLDLEPESATNSLIFSRDFSSWSRLGTPSVSKNATGFDGESSSAYTVEDTSASVTEGGIEDQAVPDDSNPASVSFLVAKNVSPSTYPAIGVRFLGGTTTKTSRYTVDPSDGSITLRTGRDAATATYLQDWSADFWRITLIVTNNSTGNTTLRAEVYPAVNTDGSATWDTSTTGSHVFDQVDVVLNASIPSSPIVTAGSTVTRSADTLKGKAAALPYSSTAMSIALIGRMTYADLGQESNPEIAAWNASSTNFIRINNDTIGSRSGQALIQQREDSSGQDESVSSDIAEYAPGVNISLAIASRNTSGAVQGASKGVSFTADTTPTALPDLSSADVELFGKGGAGQIDTLRLWGSDIGTAGIEEATA